MVVTSTAAVLLLQVVLYVFFSSCWYFFYFMLRPLYAYSLLRRRFRSAPDHDVRRTSSDVQTGATEVKFRPELPSDVKA